jgi:histidinol-phosphatase
MAEPWRAELDLAMEAAWAAGRATLRWFLADPAAELKADGSPVTLADREAEQVIRRMVRARFPDDGVVGEEHGVDAGGSGRRWIIDPIDGTRSFVRGVPLYGIMVALEAEGDAVAGVLHFPALSETVAAARGLGCRWNGRPCRVSEVDRLENALVLTSGDTRPGRPAPTGPDGQPDPTVHGRLAGLQRLAARADTFRTWGDCYGYALVATGRAEVMLDPTLHVWDAAAVRPVIEEAGGVFTAWDGAASHDAGHAVGTNARLAGAVREELDRAAAGEEAS